MNIVDIVIILVLIFGAFVGAKKGFTRQLVDTVGTIVVIIFSFLLKGIVSSILYQYFPFFDFSGSLHGITSLNLLLFEGIAFFLTFTILSSVLKVIKLTTSVFEKILKMTIVLGIPSKILGAIVGVLQNFIFMFIALYFLSLPVFQLEYVKNSKLTNKILNSTPLLSTICGDTLEVFKEFDQLLKEYEDKEDRSELNQKTLNLLIDKKIVDIKVANELIAKGKLKGVEVIQREEA